VNELLADYEEGFEAALGELAGCAQFTLRARYVADQVLREVLEEQPEVVRVREEVRALPGDSGYYQRIRLGELVAQSMENKRRADSALIVDRLAPFAEDVTSAAPNSGEAVVDASFLVTRDQLVAFETAAERLARDWDGRVRLRLLGPLAPYDFATTVMSDLQRGR
jgi:hypothetical protein